MPLLFFGTALESLWSKWHWECWIPYYGNRSSTAQEAVKKPTKSANRAAGRA